MVSPLATDKKTFGAITLAEGIKIYSADAIAFDKLSHRVYYLATKLAFLAGLRGGENCGLYTEDVKDVFLRDEKGNEVRFSYLDISMQWNHSTWQRTLVKNKEIRQIPLSPQLREELDPFISGEGRFVFSLHPTQHHPINGNRLRDWFYKRMEQVGITEKQRKERNIAFHSIRRFFITQLRNNQVPDHIIRCFAGHKTEGMTELYTDYLLQDLGAIRGVQEKLVGKKGDVHE